MSKNRKKVDIRDEYYVSLHACSFLSSPVPDIIIHVDSLSAFKISLLPPTANGRTSVSLDLQGCQNGVQLPGPTFLRMLP